MLSHTRRPIDQRNRGEGQRPFRRAREGAGGKGKMTIPHFSNGNWLVLAFNNHISLYRHSEDPGILETVSTILDS